MNKNKKLRKEISILIAMLFVMSAFSPIISVSALNSDNESMPPTPSPTPEPTATATPTPSPTPTVTPPEETPTPTENVTEECETLWYFDEESLECQQKEFCGAYMYEGLHTFETGEECKAALEEYLEEKKGETPTPGVTPIPSPSPAVTPTPEVKQPTSIGRKELPITFEATDPALFHCIGHAEGTDWYATSDDPNGHMIHGPYIDLLPGTYKVTFRMKVDENSGDEKICKLEVAHEYGEEVIKDQQVTGRQFSRAGEFQNFSSIFTTDEKYNDVEFRVYYFGNRKLTVDYIRLESVDQPLLQGANQSEQNVYQGKIIDKVNLIMDNLKHTGYTNHNYIREDELGAMFTDCSGFVGHVLKQVSEKHYDELPRKECKACREDNECPCKYPLAADYYDYFVNMSTEPDGEHCWQRVEHIKDAQPGDVIAYKYDPEEGKSTTGHVMIIYSTPKQSTCSDTNQHYVQVVDSARSGHYKDTRNGEGPYSDKYEYKAWKIDKPSGLGIGKMWFNTGSKPYYRWSSCSGDKHEANIAIGRPIECYQQNELCRNMTIKEAVEIAENSYCTRDGSLKSTYSCNNITGTWWIDLDMELEGDLSNCNPACVINVENKTAEINWRCTGLNAPENESLSPLQSVDYGPYGEMVVNNLTFILNNIEDTEYVHGPIDSEHINKSIGKYHTDCSGLGDFVLSSVLPNHYEKINESATHKKWNRPRALDYYEFFKERTYHTGGDNCWQRIHWMKNARPGDVIAYTYKEGDEHKDTGHVMFIYSNLTKIKGKNEYSFYIVDSTSHPHGDPETRGGKGEPKDGVGKGKISMGVGDDGRYLRWDGPGSSKLYRLIKIARSVECD